VGLFKVDITRRDFIRASSVGAGTVLTGLHGAKQGLASTNGSFVVARRHGTVEEMVGQCVETLGGIERFVPDGAKVVIKPNMSFNDTSRCTSPEVVREIVRLVKSANPAEITVYDHVIEGRRPWVAFKNIASVVEAEGCRALDLHWDKEDYVERDVPGVGLKLTHVARVLDEADVLINMPHLSYWSNSLKNHLGSILYRGLEEQDIPDMRITPHGCIAGLEQGIADLNSCPSIRSKHVLSIIDGIHPRVDTGATYDDYNGIIAGTDPVATDYIGTMIVKRITPSINPYPHIQKAAALGLGTNNPFNIAFEENDVSAPIPEFGLPLTLVGMAGLAGMALARRSGRRGEDV
jgi:uncharacterized protein (DUF362 family)